MGKIPSTDDIYRLAQSNPIIYACIQQFTLGHVSWDEMMRACIVLLAEQVEVSNKQLIDCISRTPTLRL